MGGMSSSARPDAGTDGRGSSAWRAPGTPRQIVARRHDPRRAHRHPPGAGLSSDRGRADECQVTPHDHACSRSVRRSLISCTLPVHGAARGRPDGPGRRAAKIGRRRMRSGVTALSGSAHVRSAVSGDGAITGSEEHLCARAQPTHESPPLARPATRRARRREDGRALTGSAPTHPAAPSSPAEGAR